jgi:hypothetical protein
MSCSRQAALISLTSSAVRRMSGTRRVSISPASVAAFTVSVDSVLISVAAVWLRSASLRTSLATTAKPRPCSPAGRLDRGVEREQVGLAGDFLDDADLVAIVLHGIDRLATARR